MSEGRAGVCLVLALAAVCAGCTLFGTEVASDDHNLVCEVTLRNPDAEGASGVAGGPIYTVSSGGFEFFGEDGSVRFNMDVVSADGVANCPGTFGSIESAEEFWRLAVQQRIQECEDPNSPNPSNSIICLYREGWCEEPETLGCTDVGVATGFCRPFEQVTNTVPLPVCAPSPVQPGDPCLEITCGDDTSCPPIEFGNVLVGDTVESESVVLTNCGDPDVEVRGLDGEVRPPDDSMAEIDFEIPRLLNTCYPPDPDNPVVTLASGESCSFRVVFAPQSPGEHRGETTFSTAQEEQTIGFAGDADGGRLDFTVSGMPVPDPLCVDDLTANGCTAEVEIDVTNTGPGAVNINDVRPQGNQGFEVVNPPPPPPGEPLQVRLGPNEPVPFRIRFRWCGAASEGEQDSLIVNSDDVAQPTFSRSLLREPCGCELDPTLVAAYGFEGAGPSIQDLTGNGHDGTLVGPAQRNPAGQSGGALELTGGGGHVNLGTGLDVAGDELTIALWFKADDFDVQDARLISKAVGFFSAADHYWMVSTRLGQELRFVLNTAQGGPANVDSAAPNSAMLQADVWTHVAVTYDGAQLSIYKDGAQIASGAQSGTIVTESSVEVWIGDSPPNGQRSFDGLIDEVRIYGRALVAQEIEQIMNCPLIPIPPGP